jgi:hypothetical protein
MISSKTCWWRWVAPSKAPSSLNLGQSMKAIGTVLYMHVTFVGSKANCGAYVMLLVLYILSIWNKLYPTEMFWFQMTFVYWEINWLDQGSSFFINAPSCCHSCECIFAFRSEIYKFDDFISFHYTYYTINGR